MSLVDKLISGGKNIVRAVAVASYLASSCYGQDFEKIPVRNNRWNESYQVEMSGRTMGGGISQRFLSKSTHKIYVRGEVSDEGRLEISFGTTNDETYSSDIPVIDQEKSQVVAYIQEGNSLVWHGGELAAFRKGVFTREELTPGDEGTGFLIRTGRKLAERIVEMDPTTKLARDYSFGFVDKGIAEAMLDYFKRRKVDSANTGRGVANLDWSYDAISVDLGHVDNMRTVGLREVGKKIELSVDGGFVGDSVPVIVYYNMGIIKRTEHGNDVKSVGRFEGFTAPIEVPINRRKTNSNSDGFDGLWILERTPNSDTRFGPLPDPKEFPNGFLVDGDLAMWVTLMPGNTQNNKAARIVYDRRDSRIEASSDLKINAGGKMIECLALLKIEDNAYFIDAQGSTYRYIGIGEYMERLRKELDDKK